MLKVELLDWVISCVCNMYLFELVSVCDVFI